MLRSLVVIALLVPAAASAETLFDTHQEVAMPIGKTVKLYRPKQAADCAAAVHHQAGKTAMPLRPACAPQAARGERAERRD